MTSAYLRDGGLRVYNRKNYEPVATPKKEVKMKIEKIYAIDTTGTYPIAAVRYEGCSPNWKQYHNDKQIQEYLNTHNDYEVNTNKKIGLISAIEESELF